MLKRIFGMLVLVCAGLGTVSAQQPDALNRAMKTELEDHVLTFREFHDTRDLKYDHEGRLIGTAKPCSWTVCGRVEIGSAKVKDSILELRGRRLYAVYDSKRKNWRYRRGERIGVQVGLHGAADLAQIRQIIDRIFLKADEDLAAVVPEYWHSFLSAPVQSERPVSKVSDLRQQGTVKPPKVIRAPDPRYTEAARSINLEGTVVLWLKVTEEGLPSGIQIVTPLGAGLDDEAVVTVQGWRFEPALFEGKPREIQINVEINFRTGGPFPPPPMPNPTP